MQEKSYFHDPIHGHIALTGLEKALVDTVEFQRLRYIRQLSLMHYVFPGSFHTRFAHSLGVCHVAARVARQLFPGEINERNYCLQVFRIAALLHDIGHGAFSHSLAHITTPKGSFLPTLPEMLEKPDAWGFDLLQSKELLAAILSYYEGQRTKPIAHELLSILIIHRLFTELECSVSERELLQGIEAGSWMSDVSALLTGAPVVSEAFIQGANDLEMSKAFGHEEPRADELTWATALQQIFSALVAGTLDCDRMDYLLRDSQNCGVSYGHFDLDGLISSMRLVQKDGVLLLAIHAKRANTLDDFLWSRYQMFRQVYCHKTHNAYNLLLGEAFLDLIRLGELSSPMSLAEYLTLTDDRVMAKVFWLAQTGAADAPWTEAFARRHLPQFLGVYEASVNDECWKLSPQEIFTRLEMGQYKGWESDPRFCYTTLKTEVLKPTGHASRDIPLLVDIDKVSGKFYTKSFLGKSVFFNSQLPESERLSELRQRLNRKMMFFYRHTFS